MVFEMLSKIDPPMTFIERGLYVGDVAGSHNVELLRSNNITAMVSLANRPLAEWNMAENRAQIPAERHLFVRWVDTPTQDILSDLAGICDFIDKMRREGGVLVHCTRGVSRSATVVVAYLMRLHSQPVSPALAAVQRVRRVRPNSSFLAQLEVWHEMQYECWEDTDHKVPKEPYAMLMKRRAEEATA